jgi:hypothetical protein
MKRKVPVLKINVEFDNPHYDGLFNYDGLLEIPELKVRMIEESLVAIKDAIRLNKNKVALVEINNSGYYIEIEKSQFKPSLQNALEYYLKKEEYDKCIECRDLISKL